MAFDLTELSNRNKIYWNEKEVFPLSSYGKLYPKMVKEPLKYI
jgi:hypothetical protein